jgi:ABC-type sugar transport system ATPase subunit
MTYTQTNEMLLEARGLCKNFGGVSALDRVDFHIRRGEHVGLLGDNGAGKSTLVKALTGALRPDEGNIWFDGRTHQFSSPSEARQAGIETVYQNLALADQLDVVANLFLGREEYRVQLGPFSVLSHERMKRKAGELLEQTGVNIPHLHDPVMKLSGGQRQTVAIARAVGWGSKLIVMDEPTAALGVKETGHVEQIIRNLKTKGIAALIVSHNLRQVFELCDSIWVMRRGRIAAHRPTSSVTAEDIVRAITGAETVGVV